MIIVSSSSSSSINIINIMINTIVISISCIVYMPTKICWLKNTGKSPMDSRIPPLEVEILLGSDPLKSRILVRRLAVNRSGWYNYDGGRLSRRRFCACRGRKQSKNRHIKAWESGPFFHFGISEACCTQRHGLSWPRSACLTYQCVRVWPSFPHWDLSHCCYSYD